MEQNWLQVKIDDDTQEKLVQLAKETERTKSSMVRWLISQEYERIFRSKKSTYQQPTAEQST